ncbi:MAG: IS200/IS605 family element transposase accessory protein TnpB [Pyrobaculum sp.]|jgi:IS605 OrfB family transposase|nr:IS200/IS605 family element transposase accessory protein TnpB [Pyrobaculum sp.]
MPSKTLTRTVAVNCFGNSLTRRILRSVEDAYRRMVEEMAEYAVRHGASQATLHKVFYAKFRREHQWLPTRLIKGAYRDAVRRAKSFRAAKKRGKAYTEMPEVRHVTLTFSDAQDWRLEGGALKLRIGGRWVDLRCSSHKQLHRYLYGGWRLTEELKLKRRGKHWVAYLTFKRDFDVDPDPRNVVAVDVNENNVTAAVFVGGVLREVWRLETGLGRMVIAYAERRRKIAEGRHTSDREVGTKLKRLRERRRKLDVVRKAAKFIEQLAEEHNAVVAVGRITQRAKEKMEEDKGMRLRHRIHQWSVRTLVRLLEEKPIQVVEVSEAGTSSRTPSGVRITFSPLVIRTAVRGASGRVRPVKMRLRVGRAGDEVWERDVLGAVNIGLRYLQMGGFVALAPTGAHAVRAMLVNPHLGPTPLAEISTIIDRHR